MYPGQYVSIKTLKLPKNLGMKPEVLIPNMIEDDIAEGLDSLHFIANKNSKGKYDVCLTNRSQVEEFYQQLNFFNVQYAMLKPDFYYLPQIDQHWTIFVKSEYVYVRQGQFTGFKINKTIFHTLFEREVLIVENELVIDIYGDETFLDKKYINLNPLLKINIHEINPDFSWPIIFDINNKTNLLEGLSTIIPSNRSSNRRYWTAWAIIFLGLWTYISAQYYFNYQLSSKIESVESKILDTFKLGFPEVNRIVDPLIQARQAVTQNQNEQDKFAFLHMFFLIGEEIKEKSSQIEIVNISYSNSILNLIVKTDSISQLESLRSALSRKRLMAEIISSQTTEQKIESKLRIEM